MISSMMLRDLKECNLKLRNNPHKWDKNYKISL